MARFNRMCACCVACDEEVPHLLEHLLMIIDEVARLKRKTIKTLPVPQSSLLMSRSMHGPARRTAD